MVVVPPSWDVSVWGERGVKINGSVRGKKKRVGMGHQNHLSEPLFGSAKEYGLGGGKGEHLGKKRLRTTVVEIFLLLLLPYLSTRVPNIPSEHHLGYSGLRFIITALGTSALIATCTGRYMCTYSVAPTTNMTNGSGGGTGAEPTTAQVRKAVSESIHVTLDLEFGRFHSRFGEGVGNANKNF